MPRFDQYRQKLFSAVDDMHAERVRVFPMNGGRQDQTRTVLDLMVPLKTADRESQNLSGDRSGDFNANVRVGGARLLIDPSTYPNPDIREKDRVVALDRPGEPAWKVSSIDSKSNGRIIINLGDAN
ncbi:hypothetical protein [uncultured Roseibium sp.]|uniref:hypothetical protein n=1 Tax=uncultured Roseibium sp. TaxID=1936171 RepID=UPI0026124720|nr:hypothetical protein [uncultured Roseibium sp.]